MKKSIILFISCALLILSVSSCTKNNYGLSPKKPTTITMWHNYGGIMQESMENLVDIFNNTEGEKLGIVISITSINSTATLQEKILQVINDEPLAPELPDITTCYPSIAVLLNEKNMIANLSEYISEEDLNYYIPSFLEEGEIDDKLVVFPIAKSTEVLFVNATLFDEFAIANNISYEDLNTFEGIFKCANLYYKWCGKDFFTADSFYNIVQTVFRQKNQYFENAEDKKLNTNNALYKELFSSIENAVSNGGIIIYDGYSSDLSKTGEIVCSIGSTAGILFYGDKITYPNNETRNVEFKVLPYPVFQDGNKIALQRGNGMSVIHHEKDADSKKKEYAASLFLKWFTQPENNLYFISETGYLPVMKDSYNKIMSGNIPETTQQPIINLLKTASLMESEYTFYYPLVFDDLNSLSKAFEKEFKSSMKKVVKAK